MKTIYYIGAAFLVFFLVQALDHRVSSAQVYRYKDAEGNWVFTNIPATAKEDFPPEKSPAPEEKEDLQEKLSQSFPAKNLIEQARNATVLITYQKGSQTNVGSGFFINDGGYIITNKHVVKDRNGKFDVHLIDKSKFTIYGAKVSDKYDLALLKLTGYKSPFIAPFDPHQLQVGVPLYAIGSPQGFTHTVTSGIFSGLRESKNGSAYIQTNAQINEGNSGGPLVTEDGKVVGINTSKVVGVGIEGLGFAIPIDIALSEFKDDLQQ
jgi:S1-C subfamily serine protease